MFVSVCLSCIDEGAMKEHADDVAAEILSRSWTPTVLAGIAVTENLWLSFLKSPGIRGQAERFNHDFSLGLGDDWYLRDCSLNIGTRAVVIFLRHLEAEEFTRSNINHVLRTLRAVLVLRGGNSRVLDEPGIRRLRTLLTSRTPESNFSGMSDPLLLPVLNAVQYPITLDMLQNMRADYWAQDVSHSNRRMIYLASMTAFYRGLRVSNVANTGSKKYNADGNDHRYHVRDISLEVNGTLPLVTVSQWKLEGMMPVTAWVLCCRSSKTHGPTKAKKTVPPMVLIQGNGSEAEQQFMADMVTWLSEFGLGEPEDLLFARFGRGTSNAKVPTYKMLMAVDLCTAIKDVACKFGFKKEHFSSRSLRIGANNEIAAQGGTDGERMATLDHATLSSNVLYLRSQTALRKNPLSADGALSSQQVLQMTRYI